MLEVDFFKQSGVYFRIIGNYFLLGDGTNGHIRDLKESVEELCEAVYFITEIDWAPIDKYLEDNKKSYGKFEEWNKTASELPEDDWSALHWASLLIEQQKGMVELSKSSRTEVRQMVAHAGYCLSYLANDKDDSVRREVAEQGYNLSGFIKDRSYYVREAVAEQGYGLDVLYKDKITAVRVAVARQGYRLDVMIEDKSPYVRAEVAKQGYGIDKLSNDNSKIVQRAIKEYEMN
ncbi:hypothetical protein [Psychrobacter sp. P11F6]|uniref:hypothetical protein n=1 Tax=Psychrobacter sp. P11F6 TaxID=1699621 RepID=UPI0007619B7B|nr:hypothetical protein [Psychrobacter sp. P11F6]